MSPFPDSCRRCISGSSFLRLFVKATLLLFWAVLPVNVLRADQLLKRPRLWWEYDARASASDSDHLGRGWDAIYLGDHASDGATATFQYNKAYQEFLYVEKLYLSRINQNTKSTNIYYLLATALGLSELEYRFGSTMGADALYRTIVDMSPEYPLSLIYYSDYLRSHGLFDQAISLTKKAISLRPSNALLHRFLAMIYAENHQTELAQHEITLYNKLTITTDPSGRDDLDLLFQPTDNSKRQ